MERLGNRTRTSAVAVWMVLALFHDASAESVYKCRDARGATAYQDHACSDPSRQTQVQIAAAPSLAVAPSVHADPHKAGGASTSRRAGASASANVSSHGRSRAHESVSFECRAANGEVFYRHSSCPKSIRTQDIARGERGGKRLSGGGRSEVSAVPLTRAEACRRLAASGGRAGHDRDDQVSTYERNAGRDPCRRS